MSETKVEIYLAEVTLNKDIPADKMIVIENEDSIMFINKELFSISFEKPMSGEEVKIKKLDNVCYLNFKL